MPSRTSKFRGSRTHGRGKKAGRGSGKRGGRGGAGLHKHKYMSIIKYDPEHFGRKGFKRPRKVLTIETTINVSTVEEKMDQLLQEKKFARKKGKNIIEVDLKAMGIDKLLGSGRVSRAMNISVPKASMRAIQKIEKAGGKVTIEKVEEEKEVKE